tara:strand:- start:5989 stop:6369 length:381 start_codon:yes stop_codon:yes gene_type:complete
MQMVGFKINDDKSTKEEVNMEELMNEVNKKFANLEINDTFDYNMDNYIALETEYNINYIIPQLHHIAKYYDISVRKKNKGEIVQDIVLFELDPTNIEIVTRRQYLWQCVNEINSDNYLHKFLNISV